MPKFRKRPVVITAEQWLVDTTSIKAISTLVDADKATTQLYFKGETIEIPTLEGIMIAIPNDWIIKGVKGELYPCKPDIFAATYEEVT